MSNNHKFWSLEEENIIIDNYPLYGVAKLRELLPSFSEKQIQGKVSRLQQKGSLPIRKNHYSEDEISFIKENYNVLGPTNIGEFLGRNPSCIAQKAYSLDLHMDVDYKKIRAWNNEDLSHLINIKDPFVAYFWGYFWADGHIEKECDRITFAIATEDFNLIKDKLMSLSISWVSEEKLSEHGTPITWSRLCHRDLCTFLRETDHEIKSGASAAKILAKIPSELQHYWWRGLFDGDGNFSYNHDHRTVRASIASCYNQDWSFSDELGRQIDINFKVRKQILDDGTRNSSLIMEGEARVRKFCRYIYQGEWFGLDRKKNQYLEWEAIKKTVRPNKKSKYRGVTLDQSTNKWLMRLYYKGKRNFAFFLDEEEAARAYDKLAKELFKDKAVLNFPNE